MDVEPPPLGPAVGGVVVVDPEEGVLAGAVEDDADAVVDPGGPEVLVTRAVDPVELQAGVGRVGVEGGDGGPDGGHLLRREAHEGVGEGCGEAEGHAKAATSQRRTAPASCLSRFLHRNSPSRSHASQCP